MPDFAVSTAFNAVDRMSRAFRTMGRGATAMGATTERAFNRASRAGGMFRSVVGGIISANLIQRGFRGLVDGMKSFVTEASTIEDATAAFTPLLGSVDKANQLVERLNQEAASTPFQFENISDAAKQLLPVMNGDIERTAETFRMLGDTAGGNAQKLQSITRGFTKSLLKGKVDMESLNMIAEAGVPIYSELASSMGVSVQEMMDMSRAGTITADDLTNAFKAMTSEGGIFFNGMEIASQTLSGRLSTLSDNIKLAKAAIGTALMPVIKPLVDRTIELAGRVREWATANQDIIQQKIPETIRRIVNIAKRFAPIVGTIVTGMIAWKVATIGLMVAQRAQAAFLVIGKFLQFVKIIMMITKAKGFWTAAQWALNMALNANPLGLITIAIFAMIGAIVLAIKYWDQITGAIRRAWDWIYKTKELILLLLGPIGVSIAAVINLATSWRDLVAAFKEGGLIGLFREIGSIIWDTIIAPLQQVIDLSRQAINLVKSLNPNSEAGQARQQRREERRTARQAPNAGQAMTQRIGFTGQLNIVGAPPGSTATSRTTGASPINMALLGVNP